MVHVKAEDDADLNEVMQMLEAQPLDTTSLAAVVPLQIMIRFLLSARNWQFWFSKEAIGAQLTHDQVKRLSDKNVQKYFQRYEAYVGNKTTDSLIDSAIMLFSKGAGLVVSIDDVKELQKELKNDYIIN